MMVKILLEKETRLASLFYDTAESTHNEYPWACVPTTSTPVHWQALEKVSTSLCWRIRDDR